LSGGEEHKNKERRHKMREKQYGNGEARTETVIEDKDAVKPKE
jgi:hypothetical protein